MSFGELFGDEDADYIWNWFKISFKYMDCVCFPILFSFNDIPYILAFGVTNFSPFLFTLVIHTSIRMLIWVLKSWWKLRELK